MELNELRKTAEAATPGPWQWGPEESHWGDCGPNLETVERGPLHADGSQGAAAEVVGSWGHDANGISVADEDKDFIATFDPETVLALLSRLEQAEQAVQRVRELCRISEEHAQEYGDTASVYVDDLKLALRALDGES